MPLNPIGHAKVKLNHLIISFGLVGLIFILLGLAIILIPEIVQYLFVIGFVMIGVLSIVIALRISHLRDIVDNWDIIGKMKR